MPNSRVISKRFWTEGRGLVTDGTRGRAEEGRDHHQRRLWVAAEAALLAIGRLERGLDRSPIEGVWQLRSEIEAASALVAVDGALVDRDRLYALMAGLEIKRLRDYGTEAQAIRLLHSLRQLADRAALSRKSDAAEGEEADNPWERSVNTVLARMAEAEGAEGDLVLALRTLRHLIIEGIPVSAALAALPLHLARKGLTRRYLPALLFTAASVIASSEQEWVVGSLERLTRS